MGVERSFTSFRMFNEGMRSRLNILSLRRISLRLAVIELRKFACNLIWTGWKSGITNNPGDASHAPSDDQDFATNRRFTGPTIGAHSGC
jgi:hypothetical protein